MKTNEYRQLVAAYKQIPKAVLDDLHVQFSNGSFVFGDSHATAFNEGRRAAVLYLESMRSEEIKVTEEEK